MDVSALEAALPAAIVAAVAGTPQGLTNANQVYVAREPRRASSTSPSAWFRPVGSTPEDPALGAARSARTYQLIIDARTPTLAQLQRWAEQVSVYFHGYRRPAVTDLLWAEVGEVDLDLHERDGAAMGMSMSITFHGED